MSALACALVLVLVALCLVRMIADGGGERRTLVLEEAAGFMPRRDERLLQHFEGRFGVSGAKDLPSALKTMADRMREDLTELGISHAVPPAWQQAKLIRQYTGFDDFKDHMREKGVPVVAWARIFDSIRGMAPTDWGQCLSAG